MEIKKDQVTVLIPTLNEEPTIGDLIRRFFELGYSDILVIDGNRTEKTQDIATQTGARVILQKGQGKGTAFNQAIT